MDRIASATKWQTPSFGFTKLQIMSGGLHGHFVSMDIRYVHGYFCVYGHLLGSTDLFMCLRTLLCLRTLRVYGHIVSADTLCLRALLICGHLPPGSFCLRALSVSKDTCVYGHFVYGIHLVEAIHLEIWSACDAWQTRSSGPRRFLGGCAHQ